VLDTHISPKGIGIYFMKYYYVNVGYSYTPKNSAVKAMDAIVRMFAGIVISENDLVELTGFWDKRIIEYNQQYKRCGDMSGGRSDYGSPTYHYCESYSVHFLEIKQEIPQLQELKPMRFPKQCVLQLSLF
jgi:hypothetical protein